MQMVQDAYCRRMHTVAALLYTVIESVLVLFAIVILRLFSFALFVIALQLVFPRSFYL